MSKSLSSSNKPETKPVTAGLGTMKKPSAQNAFNQIFGARQQGETTASGLKLVDPALIAVSSQPRTVFHDADIKELADSIAELRQSQEGIEGSGILQPLIVTALPGSGESGPRYRLIAGERRLRASKSLSLSRVPVMVLNVNDDSVLPIQLIENVQRASLEPPEEGRALRKLMDEAKLSIREAARWLGKDKSYVENRLRLLTMGLDIHAMLQARPDTMAHARLIDAVTDERLRARLIGAVVEEGIGEREVRRRISGDAPDEDGDNPVSLRKDSSKSKAGAAKERSDALDMRLNSVGETLSHAIRALEAGDLSDEERRRLKKALQQWKASIHKLEANLGK